MLFSISFQIVILLQQAQWVDPFVAVVKIIYLFQGR